MGWREGRSSLTWSRVSASLSNRFDAFKSLPVACRFISTELHYHSTRTRINSFSAPSIIVTREGERGDLESMVERSWRNFFLSSNPNWLRIILFLGIFPKFVMKSKSITSSLERFLDRFERFLRSLRIVEMLRFPSFLPSGRESVFRLCNPRGLQRVGRGQIGSVHLRY